MCLSIGNHSSLQGGQFVWNATATTRAPKKGGETFVVVSPRNVKDTQTVRGWSEEADTTIASQPSFVITLLAKRNTASGKDNK